MTQFLEASMLICFGCSWPLAVYKNAKAKTAKTMSIQFILLIILGYLAGIFSKLNTHTFNYVLVVYVINLLIVMANLVVYFVNRRYDRMQAAAAIEEVPQEPKFDPITDVEMLAEKEGFKRMNQMAKPNGIVFFGSSYFHGLALCEIAQNFDLDVPVYNRSIKKLSVSCAPDALEECVAELSPERVFVNIGDEDVQSASFDPDSFAEQYQWMLYRMHSRCYAKIYIVSVISKLPMADKVNEKLKKLADETGCAYVDATKVLADPEPDRKLFEILKFNAREHAITYENAMTLS